MSDLREQLERAKREHGEVRYPGDLGADVLGVRSMRLGYATTPRRTWLMWANVGALGAVAATVALVMFRTTPTAVMNPTEGQPTAVVAMQPRGADEFSVVPVLAGGTLVPQGGDVVPSVQTAVTVPGMPSFPSMSDVLNSATTTTNTEENNT